MEQLDKAAVLARIKTVGAVAVIRTATDEQAIETARAVIAGGFEIIEITFGVPSATNLITALVRQHENLLIGAGTVLTAKDVSAAVNAGAQFLVSPCVLPEMIRAAQERNVVCIPGAFTPTEIYTAYSLGADIVKIFPAVINGPQYLKAIRGPLPQIPIMPTSGVDISNVADWFKAGAVAVGAVSSVLDPVLIQNGDWDALTKRAAEFIAAVRSAHAQP